MFVFDQSFLFSFLFYKKIKSTSRARMTIFFLVSNFWFLKIVTKKKLEKSERQFISSKIFEFFFSLSPLSWSVTCEKQFHIKSLAPMSFIGRGPNYVFCLIGGTLPNLFDSKFDWNYYYLENRFNYNFQCKKDPFS